MECYTLFNILQRGIDPQKTMRILSILFLTLTLALTALAQQGLKTGGAAPAFSLDGMDGNTYDLNDYKGKVVVITFWSSRCAICQT